MRVQHWAGEVGGVEKSMTPGHVRVMAKSQTGAYLYIDVPLESARGLTPGDWISGQFGSVVPGEAIKDDVAGPIGFLHEAK